MDERKSGYGQNQRSAERQSRAWRHVDSRTWMKENDKHWPKELGVLAGAAAAAVALTATARADGLPRARSEAVLTTDMGEEVVLYDRREQTGHCLNQAAAAVWRHLDGQTTMKEMVAHLQRELDPSAEEATVWLALKDLEKAKLLETPLEMPASKGLSRRSLLRGIGAAAVLVPVISSVVAPPAYAQVSGVACDVPDTCQTFSCAGGCACAPTTEGATVCIVPTCVAPCTTTAECPPGTVCFTLGCCGPATYCVPIAPTGTNCLT